LTIVDEYARLGLAIRIGRSLTAYDVTRILEELFRQHGRPACIRSDNGLELDSKHMQNWLIKKDMDAHYIDPGSPWLNAYSESFDSIIRIICLDRCLFSTLTEAKVIVNQQLEAYNTIRPNRPLGGVNPKQFPQRWAAAETNQQPKSLTV
jgi:transposase InsO family protein